MLIVTINEVPGKKLEALGVVRGSTVQSRNLGHDLMAHPSPLRVSRQLIFQGQHRKTRRCI